jgi:CxxC motif-containing protein (DUF1111 family)
MREPPMGNKGSRWLMFVFAVSVPAFPSATAADADRLPAAALSGGAMTVADTSGVAYTRHPAFLSESQRKAVGDGKMFFETKWAFYWFEQGLWGRGPTSNAESCATCHVGNGRGVAPAAEEPTVSMVVRLSVPGHGLDGAPAPLSNYGDQLQTVGVPRLIPAEGVARLAWRESEVTFPDGEVVRLRQPEVQVHDLAYGPLETPLMLSARIAPPLLGVGLLDAVSDQTILELAARDPGDGIHGRPNLVWDVVAHKTVIGRFGHKANHPNLRQQVAAAFIGDIGLSNPLFPEQNCPGVQQLCREMMVAGKPEITEYRLGAVDAYLRFGAVPAQRDREDPAVQRGEALFDAARCSVCHVPELKTGAQAAIPEMQNQVIRPYTDLLLHDMGEGLADNRPDYAASGRDWRTAPLWGLGLSATVNGQANLLHDGRARTITEAIVWHGGEALVSSDAFKAMPKADRDALVKFVQSL